MNEIPKTLNSFKFSILCAVSLLPLVHSKYLFYGTIVHRTLVFWVLVSILYAYHLGYIRKKSILSFSLLDIALISYTLVRLIADLLGDNSNNSFWSNFNRNMGFVNWGYVVLFYFSVKSIQLTNSQKYLLSFLILIGALLTSIWGIKDAGNMIDSRLTGFLSNPMHASFYFTSSLLFITFVVCQYKFRYWFLPVVYALLATILIYSMLLTNSRAGLLSLFAGFAVFSCHSIRSKSGRKYLAIFLIMIIALGGLGYVISNYLDIDLSKIQHRYFSNWYASVSSSTRLVLWKTITSNLDNIPLTGLGEGNFNTFYIQNYNDSLNGSGDWYDSSHNIVLDQLVNFGWPGLALYLCILAIASINLFKSYINKNSIESLLGLSLLFTYIVFMFFGFDSLISLIIFSIIMAISDSHITKGTIEIDIEKNRNFIKLAPIICAISITGTLLISYNGLTNLRLLTKAANSNNLSEKILLFENAYNQSLIGKGDIALEYVLQKDFILNSGIGIDEKNHYYNSVSQMLTDYSQNYGKDYKLINLHAFLEFGYGHFEKALSLMKSLHDVASTRMINNIDYAVMTYQSGNKTDASEMFLSLFRQKKAAALARLTFIKLLLADNKVNEAIPLFDDFTANDLIVHFDDILNICSQNNFYDLFYSLMKKVMSPRYFHLLNKLSKENMEKWAELAQASGNYNHVYSVVSIKSGNTLLDPKTGNFYSKSDSIHVVRLIAKIHSRQENYLSINQIELLRKN